LQFLHLRLFFRFIGRHLPAHYIIEEKDFEEKGKKIYKNKQVGRKRNDWTLHFRAARLMSFSKRR